jgi:Ca-activated chloride channel family protein
MPAKDEMEQKGDNAVLDLNYPRQNILRVLAKNQFADGSFVDVNKDRLYNKVETTAMALLAFTMGKEDIVIYVNQLGKSVRFLLRSFEENEIYFEEKLCAITALALKSCVDKGILKGQLQDQFVNVLDQLKVKLQSFGNDKTISILNSNARVSLKAISPIVFTMSSDGTAVHEKIVVTEEKNSIHDLSKLGILKVR